MRVWAAHAVFAAILIGSLAARGLAADPLDDNASHERAVLRVAGSHGWGFGEYRATSGILRPTLVFEAPGCSQPVLVSLHSWTFEDEAITQSAPQQGYARRYIYFDMTWDTPDRQAAFVQRMKYRVLAMFGLTEYEPSQYLLLVETPPHCQAAQAIDWGPVWNRDTLAAAQASTEATTKY